MKRQNIILIAMAAVLGLACLGVGGFLIKAMGDCGEAEEARNQDYDQLLSLYGAKPYPSDENIARVREDRGALEAWLASASNLVHRGDIPLEDQTPAVFKQSLQAKVRALSAQTGAVKGKVVEAGFKFGFDKYLGEDRLPEKEHVARLSGQLAVIEQVCQALYAANILSLDKVGREAFDDGMAEQAVEDAAPRGRRKGAGRAAARVATQDAGQGLFSKQRFSFEFKARPGAFVDALNRLAALDLFVVVAEAEFHKTADPLALRESRKKDRPGSEPAAADGSAPAPADLSALSHVDRIVTDPELEPPLSVRLDLDVYSFEGV